MSKIIFDSDGLIKLNKAGVLVVLVERYQCLIPKAVYRETVIRGKKGLYEDAFEIEEIVEEEIDCREAEETERSQEVLESGDPTSLGQGEKHVLHLYFQIEGGAILSDDRTFLNLLTGYNQKAEAKSVPFLTPANAIVELERKEIIPSSQAEKGLEKIKDLIRDTAYKQTLEDLKHGGV